MFTQLANYKNYNHTTRTKKSIKYIVLHYTANDGDTARNNLEYYHREPVQKSAHYFVDTVEICCSVPWYNPAYHCGGNKYKYSNGGSFYGKCKNNNSIGIEMCSRKDGNGEYFIPVETQKRAAKFVAQLMREYNVPIDRVIRHYDVTGKICPAPMVEDRPWNEFKEMVLNYLNGKEVETVKYYETLEQIPKGEMRETVKTFVDLGIIKGDGTGLHLSEDMTRMLVFVKRWFDKQK